MSNMTTVGETRLGLKVECIISFIAYIQMSAHATHTRSAKKAKEIHLLTIIGLSQHSSMEPPKNRMVKIISIFSKRNNIMEETNVKIYIY